MGKPLLRRIRANSLVRSMDSRGKGRASAAKIAKRMKEREVKKRINVGLILFGR